jgi:hypothetical protein
LGGASIKMQGGTQSVTANTTCTITFPRGFATIPNITLCAISGTSDNSFGFINTENLTINKTGFTIDANDILQNGNIFYVAICN